MRDFLVLFEQKVNSLAELKNIYVQLCAQLPEKALILFEGEVGAGKTTSIQLICEILGLQDMSSPSFAIHHRYEAANGLTMDHVDLYRLEDDEDLESTGFWDLFMQDKALVVVEWADRIDVRHWPLHWPLYKVRIASTGVVNQRAIKIEKSKV